MAGSQTGTQTRWTKQTDRAASPTNPAPPMKKRRIPAPNESKSVSTSDPGARARPARPAADAPAALAPDHGPSSRPRVDRADATAVSHRVFRLTYANNQPREEPKLFRCRDGIAFNEINAALSDAPDAKYSYEMAINLYPNDPRALTDGYPLFARTDVIVLTTRPPLDDKPKDGARKFIQRNHGPLENEILDVVCRKYFKYCSRRFVELTADAKALLGPSVDRERWWNLEFFENHQVPGRQGHCGMPNRRRHWAAVIKKHHVSPDQQVLPAADRTSTIAYLIRDRLPTIGCEVLVSFGMDGYCTLIWNHIVRRQHPEWIKQQGFVMAELVFNELQDVDTRPPITIAFADRIVDVKILAEAGTLA